MSNSEMLMSVPSTKEVEAPLGGTTSMFRVSVTEGTSNYEVLKTYREIEDFQKKLKRKYSNVSFPSLHTTNSNDTDSKCKAADCFMKHLSQNMKTISVELVKQFLGFDAEANTLEDPVLEFKKVVLPKTLTVPVSCNQNEDTNDLFEEFARAHKLKDQQKGSKSFFDEEGEDHDLFKEFFLAKKDLQSQDKTQELITKEDISFEDTETLRKKSHALQERSYKSSFLSKETDNEIDESVMRLEDDIDDFSLFSVRSLPEPNVTNHPQEMQPMKKPALPPKKPGLAAAKPNLFPKPRLATKPTLPDKPVNVFQEPDTLDISNYINKEQAASLEEVKLFD